MADVSRSHSVAEAVRRLGLGRCGSPFHLLVLGADRCEGATVAAVAATFAPLACWLAAERGASAVHVTLRGPNLRHAPGDGGTFPACEACPLHLRFDPRLLLGADDVPPSGRAPGGPAPPVNLVAAFNAGVWGYGDSWLAALAYSRCTLRVPAVITAYCRSEAESDEEALQAAGLPLAWSAQANPWASQRPWRPTSERAREPLPGEESREENAWWLCVAADI